MRTNVKTSSQETLLFLAHQALNLRIDSMRATTAGKSGHPTSCLSAADIISVLFFHVLRYDLKNPKNPNNDRFILSKGHAIPVVYAAWKNLGVISDEQLLSLRKFDSVLEGHPTPRFDYNEAATGSLGQGLGVGVGMALQAKKDQFPYKTYVMMGDSESAEGSIWEAAELAAYYKLDNLIGIVDCNRLGQSEEVMNNHDVSKYARKWEAFGWKTITIDGHNLEEIVAAFEQVHQIKQQPTVIVAKTYKGFGLDNVENKQGYHGKPFKEDELEQAIIALRKRFPEASEYKSTISYVPEMPESVLFDKVQDKLLAGARPEELAAFSPELVEGLAKAGRLEGYERILLNLTQDPQASSFDKDKKIATRQAYGYALAALGRVSNDIFVLDGDVKNSTYTEIFEKEFPDRFVQCFVAEQNMISVSTGLQLRGKIPFAATFACFLSRAHDQIRMAGIGRNALRLCGSHAGVSIGEDGPSQMGLEDIALMRAIPDSIVLYPSDGVSAYKLVELMANYQQGISYLRTTRASTPVLYDKNETFSVGGCKVLRQSKQDKACIIAAGVTLHEALKAYEQLAGQGVFVSVIDLYSVKPIDSEMIKKVALDSCNTIITVEDHYSEGGIGEAVISALVNEQFFSCHPEFSSGSNPFYMKNLAVQKLSRSGTPEELLKYAEIDAESIAKTVLSIVIGCD